MALRRCSTRVLAMAVVLASVRLQLAAAAAITTDPGTLAAAAPVVSDTVAGSTLPESVRERGRGVPLLIL